MATINANANTPRRNPVSLTTEARKVWDDVVTNVEGWAAEARSKLPAALDDVDKIEQNPIVQAALKLAGGKYEQIALDTLNALGKFAEQELAQVPASAQPITVSSPTTTTDVPALAAADS